MNSNNAPLLEDIKSLIDDIDEIFKEYGYSPEEFDPDSEKFFEESDQQIAKIYGKIYDLKEAIE